MSDSAKFIIFWILVLGGSLLFWIDIFRSIYLFFKNI